ncbi:MAG: alpha-L-fucosidase [Tepidisphaeraceae bacterium]|jgi:alpha-L-fucosidase
MKFSFSRRAFLKASTLAAGAGLTAPFWQSRLLAASDATAPSASAAPEIPPGPFAGNRESLNAYHVPDWFADAKFGIWNHWGPQSAAEYGDWYARRMYVQGEPQYNHHLQHYGHPSKTGFVGVINSWKADKFDADYLMGLYKKAGARYYMSMGVHHDNFDMWDSKYQPRWNAAVSGPKRNILGLFRAAADKHGLRFGVSEHLSNSFCWYGPAHGSDKTGPLAGVPYDGIDPQFADLYHDYTQMPADFVQKVVNAPAKGAIAMSTEGPPSWRQNYFDRIKDVVTRYQPDLLYTDGGIPFGDYGLSLVAHLYNTSARRNGGTIEAIYTGKSRADAAAGMCVLDVERGVVDSIWPRTWQTDTCIGNWHYDTRARYKTPKRVIDMLVDIVSRNGNLLLNFPLPNNGMPDPKEMAILQSITDWMAVNSEAIYATRPWKTFGDGPGAQIKIMPGVQFNENNRQDFTSDEVRFTTKGHTLYAFFMGWPDKQIVIAPLATTSPNVVGKIENVELLGFGGKLTWNHDEKGLTVQLPMPKPCEHGYALKIAGLATV